MKTSGVTNVFHLQGICSGSLAQPTRVLQLLSQRPLHLSHHGKERRRTSEWSREAGGGTHTATLEVGQLQEGRSVTDSNRRSFHRKEFSVTTGPHGKDAD